MSIYLELTGEFNRDGLRAILSSGQAVVFHRLALMSKDGDWILRENPADLDFILDVLTRHRARYRLGAPLDVRWLSKGWSSHFEFEQDGIRVRTDFVTRPPRISAERLACMWVEQETGEIPVVNPVDLCELKKTNREKDYAVIGELARLIEEPADWLRFSRSARDILEAYRKDPGIAGEAMASRGIRTVDLRSRESLEAALDAERRRLIRANEERLLRYRRASAEWAGAWTDIQRSCSAMSLPDMHRHLVESGTRLLPFEPE